MTRVERRLARAFGDDAPIAVGTGWISGTVSVFLGVLAVGAVLCLHFPAWLTAPELRAVYPMGLIRGLIQAGIVVGFASGLLSTVLRRRTTGSVARPTLGLAGMALALVATLLGGADVPVASPVPVAPHLGLDWFLLSLFLAALLFVPLERTAPLRPEQHAFRPEWTTDLGWFFVSHVAVQALSLVIMWPAVALAPRLAVPALQSAAAALPLVVQFAAILLVADLTQYGLHRAFHEVPLLWRFHRIHHSSLALDWLAGSRLHLVDVVVTRGLVLLPLAVIGFAPAAIYAYLTFVSLHAVFIHANFGPRVGWLERVLVMPHFHHWHHAAEPEALNRNYAVHLPWLDRLFGTAWEPAGWPRVYGLAGEAAPSGVLAQLAWPFRGSGDAVLRRVRSLGRRVLLAAVAAIGGGAMTGFTFLPFGTTTQPLGTVATVAVPRRAELEAAQPASEQATWVGFRMDRFHTWAMGSGTPYRATLFLALHAPDAGARSYDEARVHCERALNGGGDDWRDLRQDERWRIGQGRYTVNLLDEPIWRLAYRDPERRVSALWQVYQRDWDLAAAEAALADMVASVQRRREPAWAEIADRPRRAAAEGARKAEAAFAWLAARGFTPLEPERPMTRDGITVEYMTEPERRLMLLHLVDGPPTQPLPPWVSTGTRTWSDAGWEDRMANHDYYPMPGTRRELERTLAKPGPHHFIIRTIRLDELAEEDVHLADFFALAARWGDPSAR